MPETLDKPQVIATFSAPGSAFFETQMRDVSPGQLYILATLLELSQPVVAVIGGAPGESVVIATFEARGSCHCSVGVRGNYAIEQFWALAGWCRWQADALFSQHALAQAQQAQVRERMRGLVIPQINPRNGK